MQYFSQIIENHAHESPGRLAYHFLGETMSYGELNKNCNRIANAFLSMGLVPGDRVSVILPQSFAFSSVFIAAGKIGLVVVPLDPRLTPFEMKTLCQRTESKALMAMAFPEEIKTKTEELLREYEFQHIFAYFGQLGTESARPFEELLNSSATPPPTSYAPSLDDPYIVIFTSGTTGMPKGALISHRNTLAMAQATAEQWKCRKEDIVLCNLPISHVGGTHDQLAVQLYSGATGILVPKFDPQELMETISTQKVTFFGAVPSMYRLIFKSCDLSKYDLASVRMTILGGEPASAELIQRISKTFFNSTIAVSWGMSETAGFFTFSAIDDEFERIEKTEGKPAPGFLMKVVGFDGELKKPGEVGEFLVQGPSVISGYLDEVDNEGSFQDGWLQTGDLGFLDEDGYMHYVGRSKEMYISGGYNVYPLEIESYLNTYPGVNAAAIIEFPDELWGEVGFAFVVPEEGIELSSDELFAYCRKGLADYKRPKKIFVTREIPRSVVGKIAKRELRDNIDRFVS